MAFDSREVDDMVKLGHTYTASVLLGALCVSQLEVATDMAADLLADPEYIKQHGMPTRDTIVQCAYNQLVYVLPDMINASEALDVDVHAAAEAGESLLETLARLVLKQLVQQQPSLSRLQITYQCR